MLLNNILSLLLASLNHIVKLYISMTIIIIIIFILLQYNTCEYFNII